MNRVATRSVSVLRAVVLRPNPHRHVYRSILARTFASSPSAPTASPTQMPFVAPVNDTNADSMTPPPSQPGLPDAARAPAEAPAGVHPTDAALDAATSAATTPLPADAASAVATAADAAAATGAVADAATAAATTSSFSETLLLPATWLLTNVHDWTGLPWWASIALSTIAIRTMLLPVTLMTMKNSTLMGALKEDIAERREDVMKAMRTGDRSLAAVKQSEMQTFMRDAGVAPLRVLIGPLSQFPVFISFFVGIRRMALSDPSFATGGTAWFSNLAVMDPAYVLPVVCGGSLLLMTEFGGETGNKMTPQMKMGMRAVAGLSVPMTYWFPAAVFCYWIPNNIFSASLGMATRSRPGRRLLGLDVNLAAIPGTKAFKQLMAKRAREGQTVAKEAMDSALAIASYGKGRPTPSAATVKPVLLKTRPKKKASARSK